MARVSTGFRTLTPFIIHNKAPELVDFMKSTFDAEELKRNTAGEAYGFYSEVRIGDSVIMIGGGTAARWGNLPGAFHVYVEDCDAAYRRALEAGAVTLMGATGEPADRPYGERSCVCGGRLRELLVHRNALGVRAGRGRALCKVLEPCCRMCIQRARGSTSIF